MLFTAACSLSQESGAAAGHLPNGHLSFAESDGDGRGLCGDPDFTQLLTPL